MGSLTVSSVTVPTLLETLHRRVWQVPKFQREFVWSVSEVVELLISIIQSRPIGMATIWEQPDDYEIDLTPIYVLDYFPGQKQLQPRLFTDDEFDPSKVFAILDGRQRCTAIAMAFGGLRALDGRVKHAGRYFLDVTAEDDSKRIQFIREVDIKKRNLDVDVNCISQGLFPLASNQSGEEILAQWMRYVQSIRDASFYADSILPPESVLNRRDSILKKAFEGIIGTKLAVYSVPDNYHLSQICEIFETLNMTGAKVSTVDLIHSWLYAETAKTLGGPIQLREWIADLGQKDGAIGWATPNDRPELIAQIVTACYVALVDKPEPRKVSGKIVPITSVKAADLLATPTKHWESVMLNDELLAEFLGNFQRLVGGGYFPYTECPYPLTAAIYVAMRWHLKFDLSDDRAWGRDDLDAVFRAFFWRNSLTRRYDQGFLTQLAADIKELKGWLALRGQCSSSNDWASKVQKSMGEHMGTVPDEEYLVGQLTNTRPAGALGKALTLLMIAGVQKDLVDSTRSLAYPAGENVELHHIYPKGWCNKTKVGEFSDLFDKDQAGREWVDSVANLMPLSRKSNNEWKAKFPGQLIVEKKITFDAVRTILRPVYIDQKCFNILTNAPSKEGIQTFWEHRARLIAGDLVSRTAVTL